jgi:hypothetical protein
MFGWECGCCDVGGAIGFDEFPGFNAVMVDCITPRPTVIHSLAFTIHRIVECKLVFAGNFNNCQSAVRFNRNDWGKVKDWLKSGGRMYLAAEHSGNSPFPCLQDMTVLNEFLEFIGTSIRYVGDDYNASTPTCNANYYDPGAAQIAAGIHFSGSRFGEISGGTSLWIGTAGTGGTGSGAGKVAAAIDRIDGGFIVVIGDSNSFLCDGYCDFVKRFYERDSSQII